MCVNADESEPATFNNRLLMEKDPHQFIEGILIACFATKASDGVHLPAVRVYPGVSHPRGGDRRGPRRPVTWARTFTASGFNLDIWLHRGAGRTSAARRPG